MDAVRGLAVLLMVGYHSCFDLNFYGQTHFRFNEDPFWLDFRTIIVGLFLCVMGVSLHLAGRGGLCWPRYVRRLVLVSVCAGLVTVGSLFLFRESYIFFGVLHFVVVASLLALPFLRGEGITLVVGLTCIVLGNLVQHPIFDHPAWQWVGMMTHKPITEDYVPLVPWFGVVLVGVWLGRWIGVGWGRLTLPRTMTPLVILGRYSLLVYMLHQPVIMGLLYLLYGQAIS